jgi:HEAT repeat protein
MVLMRSAVSPAIAVLAALWLGPSSLAVPIQQPSEPGKDQLEAIRSAKTVRIVAKVTPAKLAPNLPFKTVAEKLIAHAGLKAVESDADVTLHIEVRVESTYRFTYVQPERGKPTSDVTPTGTTLEGILRFDGAKGVNLHRSPFKAYENDESESSLRQATQSFSLSMLELIGKIFGPRTLVNALKDDEVRWQAATVLRKMGAVEALIAALKDEEARTRIEAAKVLIEIRDPRTVEPLIAALKDVNADVRAEAVVALSYTKDPRMIEPLIATLKDESKRVRLYAASALERAKDPRAIEPLVAALQDPAVEVRGRAAAALGSLKDPRTLGALIQALRELKDRESSSPAEKQEAMAARNEVRSAIGHLLEGTKDPAVVEQLALALKDQHVDVRMVAVSALAKMEAFDQLVTASKDENKSVRTAAVQFFAQSKDARAIEPLIAAAQDSDNELRRIAVLGLTKIKDARVVEPLINSLKDEEPNIPMYAAYALGEMRDPRAVEPLIVALTSPNERLRSEAAEALGKIKDPRAAEPLIAALKDQSARGRAARALGEIKEPRAIEPLIAMLKDQSNGWYAAEALKKITGQDFGTDHGKWKQWWEKSKGN